MRRSPVNVNPRRSGSQTSAELNCLTVSNIRSDIAAGGGYYNNVPGTVGAGSVRDCRVQTCGETKLLRCCRLFADVHSHAVFKLCVLGV